MTILYRIHRRGFPRNLDHFFRLSEEYSDEAWAEVAKLLLKYCTMIANPSIKENPLDKPAFFVTIEGFEK